MGRYKSRAARAAVVAEELSSLATELTSSPENANDILDNKRPDASELECLKDELESWYNNIEGTGLANTNKFTMLEEAMAALDDIIQNIESIPESIEELDEVENVAAELQEISDAISQIEFPGMY